MNENFLHTSVFYDIAHIHDGYIVRHFSYHAHVVGNHHDSRSMLPLQSIHQFEDLRADGNVQRGSRLVCQQNFRIA